MSNWPYTDAERPRVLVAGGGIAALEACLALRSHGAEADIAIDLVAPSERFVYRPLAVLEPFEASGAWSLSLAEFAADQEVTLLADGLAEVDPEGRLALTTSGILRSYDVLLVAVGARLRPGIPGALTFRGPDDTAAFRRLLADATTTRRARIVFALPRGTAWALPLYELAVLTAGHLRTHGVRGELTIVTPEAEPLAVFGPAGTAAIGELLDRHGIRLRARSVPVAAEGGDLRLLGGGGVAADRVVALPRVVGRPIAGLPHDVNGFLPVDAHGRIRGVPGVYAAGDGTDMPIKQGGLAAQQADAAAEAMLAELGLPIAPTPFRPVMRGALYTGEGTAFLRAPLTSGGSALADARPWSPWWPPSKVAARFLAPYLTLRAGAPRAPEARPKSDLVPG